MMISGRDTVKKINLDHAGEIVDQREMVEPVVGLLERLDNPVAKTIFAIQKYIKESAKTHESTQQAK